MTWNDGFVGLHKQESDLKAFDIAAVLVSRKSPSLDDLVSNGKVLKIDTNSSSAQKPWCHTLAFSGLSHGF
jgi:hypothetical protein